MNAGKIILYIVAGLTIIFGFLFILGAGSATGGGPGWVVIGLLLWAVAFGAIFQASRLKTSTSSVQNITYKVDLPANVSMDTLKCKSCGGTLAPENIQMVAGAPVVTCPYCKTTYQLTEEPKW
jgi:phage FluMu protein Com